MLKAKFFGLFRILHPIEKEFLKVGITKKMEDI